MAAQGLMVEGQEDTGQIHILADLMEVSLVTPRSVVWRELQRFAATITYIILKIIYTCIYIFYAFCSTF